MSYRYQSHRQSTLARNAIITLDNIMRESDTHKTKPDEATHLHTGPSLEASLGADLCLQKVAVAAVTHTETATTNCFNQTPFTVHSLSHISRHHLSRMRIL